MRCSTKSLNLPNGPITSSLYFVCAQYKCSSALRTVLCHFPNLSILWQYCDILSATICSTGRTAEEFESQGTGTMLSIQTGTTAASLMRIPMDESDVTSTTQFVEGQCFYVMGTLHLFANYLILFISHS